MGPRKTCHRMLRRGREAADDGMSFLKDMEGKLHGWK